MKGAKKGLRRQANFELLDAYIDFTEGLSVENVVVASSSGDEIGSSGSIARNYAVIRPAQFGELFQPNAEELNLQNIDYRVVTIMRRAQSMNDVASLHGLEVK